MRMMQPLALEVSFSVGLSMRLLLCPSEESLARMSFQIRTDYDGVSSDVHGLFQKLGTCKQDALYIIRCAIQVTA